jgi:hypothetical protein
LPDAPPGSCDKRNKSPAKSAGTPELTELPVIRRDQPGAGSDGDKYKYKPFDSTRLPSEVPGRCRHHDAILGEHLAHGENRAVTALHDPEQSPASFDER